MPDEYQSTQPSTAPTTERPEKPGTEQAHLPSSDGAVPRDSVVSEATVDAEEISAQVQNVTSPTNSDEKIHSPEISVETATLENPPSSFSCRLCLFYALQ